MKKIVVDNPRYPHYVRIIRKDLPGGVFDDAESERVLYDGICRSYTDTTTTGDGKVVTNRRKLSIPMRFDSWTKTDLYGDTVEVQVGNLRETGIVSDFEPDNNRSVVYWELTRE